MSGIMHFKEFFDMSLNETWNIRTFQLMDDIPYRDIFWRVKQTNEKNIILDVSKERLVEVLNQVLIKLGIDKYQDNNNLSIVLYALRHNKWDLLQRNIII